MPKPLYAETGAPCAATTRNSFENLFILLQNQHSKMYILLIFMNYIWKSVQMHWTRSLGHSNADPYMLVCDVCVLTKSLKV